MKVGWNMGWFVVTVMATQVIVAFSLKGVSVSIPTAAKVMDTVTFQCKYDLEGEPLYTVKWYKGSREFYRYIPKELPDTFVFPLPGFDVDLSKSSLHEVVLRNVRPEVTGRYRCEVSTDAPNFYTSMDSGYMYVIEVPDEDPVLSIETQLLDDGYVIKGNCSSPPSFPPANITWLINGKKISETYLDRIQISNPYSNYNARRAPSITVSSIEVEIDRETFRGGTARLSCAGRIFNVYNREREVILEDDRPRPRPSSVLGTRDAATGTTTTTSLNIPIMFLSVLWCR